MRIIISPAKQMRVDTDSFTCTGLPAFMEKTEILKDWISGLAYEQQKALWACNDKMNGIHMVFPNDDTQPEFGQVLVRAAKAGVQVVYYSCHVEADSIKITGVAGDTMRYSHRPEIQEISREQRIAFYEEIFDELQAADPAAGISV